MVEMAPKRIVSAFPEIDEFYDLLVDRLHMTIERLVWCREPFTLFVNALPRKATLEMERFDNVELIYAGVARQRIFLEGNLSSQLSFLDAYWDFLAKTSTTSTTAVVSSKLFAQFRDGQHDVKSIVASAGTLRQYFKLDKPEQERDWTERQKAEFPILRHHFDLDTYHYISVPLIQFGEFDGVVHLVYSHVDHYRTFDKEPTVTPTFIGNMIKSFSLEYENLILGWDFIDTDVDREQALRATIDAAIDPAFYETLNKNPILKDLDYLNFYKKHYSYYEKRLDMGDRVPRERRRQYRRIAIMSILIDSYAHNVTAHSLTALEWWFRLRAEFQRKYTPDFLPAEAKKIAPSPFIYKSCIAEELHPLMKFLLNKGAFWTGVTREHAFGGSTQSLFSVLWNDFINNPLYLGTIAFSEGILKLNIQLCFLETTTNEEHVIFQKRIKKSSTGELLSGAFATVDLTKLSNTGSGDPALHLSEFIFLQEKFHLFRKELEKMKAFFPGGIVGQHALFTILENEIRNVKHYSPEVIQQMKQTGLTLNISIEEVKDYPDFRKGGNPQYYKLGVWINHPVFLDKEIMLRRLNLLGGDIINEETYRPRLGGTYQDKVCAAMLFNNTFVSVQDRETPRDRRFYPWIKIGASFEESADDEVVVDYELSWRRFSNQVFSRTQLFFDRNFSARPGFFKKFFHLWRGEEVYNLMDDNLFTTTFDNLSRYKFISIPPEHWQVSTSLRMQGVFRIIVGHTPSLQSAYSKWLKNWMKELKPYRIRFEVNKQTAAHLFWDTEKVVFQNRADIRSLDPAQIELINHPHSTELQTIPLQHGNQPFQPQEGPLLCRYRSHGVLIHSFTEGQPLAEATMTQELASELFEVLATKILIFDNRIAKRLEDRIDLQSLEEGLNCKIVPEDVQIWLQEKSKGFFRYHFLVIHLSFIESLKDHQGRKRYSEENIQDFILNEILTEGKPAGNFILVITTGRGRTQWWDNLEDSSVFRSFLTFRPVESLIDQVEQAISMEDDFDLKYSLVKILFGS